MNPPITHLTHHITRPTHHITRPTHHITHIYHLADIHIGANVGEDSPTVYKEVFAQLAQKLTIDTAIVVIAGDLFHNKNKYTPTDIELFYTLIESIKQPVIIIPGNHDINMNLSELDLISPLKLPPHCTYLRDTTTLTIGDLTFFHLSVNDEATLERTSELTHLDTYSPHTILLYHGMVDGAKFGKHTASNTRISLSILNKFKLCLLGDIHETQHVTPAAAYPGSLIQQNISESTNKGFLCWDLTTRESEFIPLVTNHKLQRIDTRGMTLEQCIVAASASPTPHIIIDDSAASMEMVAALRQHTNIRAVTTITSNVKIVQCGENMRDYLISTNNPLTEEIVAEYSQYATTQSYNRWYLRRLEFSNLFGYGPDNVIDFTTLDGIAGVIAPNRAGKSSILDIIVYAMYNEHLRADNKTIINHYANSASFTLDFTVNNVDYQITRTIDKTKHTKHRLYRFDVNSVDEKGDAKGDEKDDEKGEKGEKVENKVNEPPKIEKVNITGASLTATYQIIESLIGTADKLLSTAVYTSDNLLCLSKTERCRKLSHLFGMTSDDEIITRVQAKAKALSAEIAKYPKHRFDPTEEIAAVTAQLAELPTYSVSELASEIAKLQAVVIPQTTSELEANITELAATLQKLPPSEVEIAPKAPPAPQPTQTQYELAAVEINATSGLHGSETLRDPAPRIAQIKKQLAEMPQAVESTSGTIQYTRKQIATLQTQLSELTLMPTQQPPKPVPYHFSPTCIQCTQNKTTLNYDAQMAKYNAQLAQYNTATAHNAECIERIARIKGEITTLNAQLRTLESQESQYQKYVASQNTTTLLTNELEQLSAIKYDARANEIIAAKKAVTAYTAYCAYCAYTDYMKCNMHYHSEISTAKAKLEANQLTLTRAIVSDDAKGKLTALQHKYNELLAKQKVADTQRGQLTARLHTLQTELEIQTTYNANVPAMQAKLAVYKGLVATLRSSDLKIALIKRNIDRTLQITNNLLSSIVDFTLNATCDDTSIEFNIVGTRESNKDGGKVENTQHTQIPYQLGSGFQKFIITIALRIALITILPSTCDHLFIDEGFGCADADNLSKMIEVLPAATSHLRFAFIISHIPELNSLIRQPLYIIPTGNQNKITDKRYVHTVQPTLNTVQPTIPTIQPTQDTIDLVDAGLDMVIVKVEEVKEKGEVIAIKEEKREEKKEDFHGLPVVQTDSIRCVCGATIKKSGIRKHEQTTAHKKKLNLL